MFSTEAEVHSIRVGEEQDFSTGRFSQLVASPVLTPPTGGKGFSSQDAKIGVVSLYLPDNPWSTIRGFIIQDDHFKIRVILPQERFQAGANAAFFIPGRDKDRYFSHASALGRSRCPAKDQPVGKNDQNQDGLENYEPIQRTVG